MKPENFLMGTEEKSNLLYIIDFGLARKYKNNNQHIAFREGKSLTGTARYASINTHKGYEQSRRDDIEAMLYIVFYLFRGSLPWQGLNGNGKEEKYRLIKEKKIATPIDELCEGLSGTYSLILLEEYKVVLEHVRNLKFEEDPNYSDIRELMLRSCRFTIDYIYDWTPITPKINQAFFCLIIVELWNHQ